MKYITFGWKSVRYINFHGKEYDMNMFHFMLNCINVFSFYGKKRNLKSEISNFQSYRLIMIY